MRDARFKIGDRVYRYEGDEPFRIVEIQWIEPPKHNVRPPGCFFYKDAKWGDWHCENSLKLFIKSEN